MADEKKTNVAIKLARDSAGELISTALNKLGETARALQQGEEPRLFFPNGIELISITVGVSGVSVEFKVAGEKGIKGLLKSGEIGAGLAGEVAKAVIEEQEDDSLRS